MVRLRVPSLTFIGVPPTPPLKPPTQPPKRFFGMFFAGRGSTLRADFLFAGDFAKCSLKRKVEDMDWEEVHVMKKARVWTSCSWGKYKVKKASEGWGDKAMMPRGGWNLITLRHMKPCTVVSKDWQIVSSNIIPVPHKMCERGYKLPSKGKAGGNPYEKITNKLNITSNFYSENLQTAADLERDMALPNIEVEEFAGITNGVTEVWIGDTGSSCHLATSDKGMINVREINDSIKVGNGTTMDATKIGDLPVIITQKDGTKTKATLKGVKFVPKLWCNLFSIGNVLSKGWSLGNEGKIITLQKLQTIIKFD